MNRLDRQLQPVDRCALAVWQRFELEESLRMPEEEVKREAKEERGDPVIRSARRRFAREVSFGQMLKDVKKASVVITNPTHIAVAIQYDDADAPVPVVVAMGKDEVAGRIREIAAEAGCRWWRATRRPIPPPALGNSCRANHHNAPLGEICRAHEFIANRSPTTA